MSKENLRMQMLAGIITEGQYKAKLNENENESAELKRLVDMLKAELGEGVTVEYYEAYDEDNENTRRKIDVYGTEDGFEGDGVFEVDIENDKLHVYYLDEDGDYFFDRDENVVAFIKKELARL
jgi:hypothetical protein